MRWNVIRAVFRRNFGSFFSNPIGYIFITLFVLAASYEAFCHDDAFFANNLAELDQLSKHLPLLLLLFVPAVTMTAWADERRTGTEELLLTLPASDMEIVLGKFFAALACFSVSLFYCAVCHFFLLVYLRSPKLADLSSWGTPDCGLFASTYFGYWLMGGALIATGLAASMMTTNVTVAFILGSLASAFVLYLPYVASVAIPSGFVRTLMEKSSAVFQFEPFGRGLISLPSVFYYVAVAFVMLYLNMVLLGRRHWSGSADGGSRWFHAIVRAVAVAVAAVCITIIATRAQAKVGFMEMDATAAKIHNLSPDTRKLIDSIDPKRPVFIEAFISEDVPRDYAETRQTLVDLLRQYERMGGGKIALKINDTKLYSQEARDAERLYEIRPEGVPVMEDGRFGRAEVFLGVALKSGLNTKTIPFMFRGLPIEYELTRLIRSVADKAKRKIGVLTTDMQLFGAFNFQSMQPGRDWAILEDLKQQYEVEQVSPDTPITANIDVLIAPMASSLSQPQMNNFIGWVKSGKPTLILDDPLPMENPRVAPREQKARNQNPMMMGNQPPPSPKGNFRDVTDLLNIDFDTGNVIWQSWNPHPQFKELPLEYVFIGPGSGNADAFNRESIITSGLQDIVAIEPGYIRPRGGEGPKATPLIVTGEKSGITPWNQIFADSVFGRSLNPSPRRRQTSTKYIIAAQIQGKFDPTMLSKAPSSEDPMEKKDDKKKDDKASSEAKSANVIFIADIDLISDGFYQLRRGGDKNLQFDNLTFFLNCVDVLAGDESFVQLRKRRPIRRNLDRLESMTESARKSAAMQIEDADAKAEDALKVAQDSLNAKVEAISKREDLDRRTKQQMIQVIQETEQRAFDIKKDQIDREKKDTVRKTNEELQLQIRKTQSWVKLGIMLIPPIPVALLGLLVWGFRSRGEREGVNPNRLV